MTPELTERLLQLGLVFGELGFYARIKH